MTTPAAEALRAELEAAIELLNPQINGFNDLLLLPLSGAVRPDVQEEQADHVRRRDLCHNVLVALDALEADHYPDMPKHDLPPSEFQELQKDLSEIEAALAEFEVENTASKVSINLGPASPKAT